MEDRCSPYKQRGAISGWEAYLTTAFVGTTISLVTGAMGNVLHGSGLVANVLGGFASGFLSSAAGQYVDIVQKGTGEIDWGQAIKSGLFSSAIQAGSWMIRNADKVKDTVGNIYGPMNRGPLPEDVANSFRSGSYTETILQEDAIFYRVSGGKAGEVGRYLSRTPQGGGLQSQLDLALNPEWGNTASTISKVKVPAGTTIYEGFAAPQNIPGGVLPGGGNQIYIPEVNSAWWIK